jgi:hypothetical protein
MKDKAWGLLTLLLMILVATCAVWIGKSADHSQLRWEYVAVTAILVALCIVTGVLVNGRLDGVLISDRNRISLARVQWVAWMIVLLGAYFVEAVWNVAHSGSFPEMQTHLFGLLGIVSGSSVVSSLIVDAKMRSPVPSGQPQAVQPLAAGDDPGHKLSNGTIEGSEKPLPCARPSNENRVFLEGGVLEVAVCNGRWVLTHVPAEPRPASAPAGHYFPTE